MTSHVQHTYICIGTLYIMNFEAGARKACQTLHLWISNWIM